MMCNKCLVLYYSNLCQALISLIISNWSIVFLFFSYERRFSKTRLHQVHGLKKLIFNGNSYAFTWNVKPVKFWITYRYLAKNKRSSQIKLYLKQNYNYATLLNLWLGSIQGIAHAQKFDLSSFQLKAGSLFECSSFITVTMCKRQSKIKSFDKTIYCICLVIL